MTVISLETKESGSIPSLQTEESLIRRFQADVAARGLVGESRNAAITFLVALSAKLESPLNLTVCGESSAGKNNLLDSVAAFLPEEMKKSLSGITPKAMCYMAEDEIEHKAIFIAEYEGVKGADYPIRTLQSEKFIQWEYVDSKNGLQKKTNRVRGPAAFLQATTRSVLHPENETRLMFIEIDESEEQTSAINRKQAARFASGVPDSDNTAVVLWQEYIRSLNLTTVIIPFAEKVVPHFPPDRIRSRRDFPKLMGLIQVSAFLHQHSRKTVGDSIMAEMADYQIARELFQHTYDAGPDRKLEELLKVAQALEKEFKVSDIMKETGWKKSKTYNLIGRAEELGSIAACDTAGCYKFVRLSTVPPLNLPESL
jgi:hypothetical protein